jgi:hypothetical protein
MFFMRSLFLLLKMLKSFAGSGIILLLFDFCSLSFADIPNFNVSFSQPHVRLGNNEITAPSDCSTEITLQSYELTSLRHEWQSVGVTLTNCGAASVVCQISLSSMDESIFSYEIRKQVLMQSWYPSYGLVSDPLPLLPRNGVLWEVQVPAGERVKLYIDIFSSEKAFGMTQTTVEVESQGAIEELSLTLNVLPASMSVFDRFKYASFIYPSDNVAGKFPQVTAKDLGAHGVDVIEFPSIGTVVFTTTGSIASADFTMLTDRLLNYGRDVNRFMIFWEGAYADFTCSDGSKLTPYSSSWNNAFTNLLSAWLAAALSKGFGVERFVILPFDEVHSDAFSFAPDYHITRMISVCGLIRSVNPNLRIMLTLTDYAGITDVNAMLPYIDIVLPVWPYRTYKLTGQPTGYNPRQAYYETILPALKTWRSNTGGEIWSYHIAAGKIDELLLSNRTYPILVIGDELTGGGTWAYNVAAGSTWSDTDGGTLDYIFVYDGSESHSFNLSVNPEGEIVVPSIRWQALRAGLQDAQILLYLKDIKNDCNATSQLAIQSILNEAADMAADVADNSYYDGSNLVNYTGWITSAYILDYAKRVRLLYSEINTQNVGPIAFYSFDKDARDLTGNGNDLTASDSGMFDSNEFVHMDSTSLTGNSNSNKFFTAMTISFWLRGINDGYGPEGWHFARKWGDGVRSYDFYYMNYPVGNERFELLFSDDGTDSVGHFDNFSGNFPAASLVGTWHHVAVTFDGNMETGKDNVFVYITPASNNDLASALIEAEATVDHLFQSSAVFDIAGYSSDIDGYIMYNRALTKSELEQLFDSGREIVGMCPRLLGGDINKDCKVDFVDFAILASHWLECGLDVPNECWN